MYLAEYQELTSKLHELKSKEADLLERIQLEQGGEPDCLVPELEPDSTEPSTGVDNGVGMGDCSIAGDEEKPKHLLRAFLPNKQRTSVQVTPGRKLRDALIKALRRRNMHCEMCEVTTVDGNEIIPWDMDISLIKAKEVQVTVMEKFPIISQISHQYIRKTFFSLAFCECCRRLLFTGFYCNQCNFRFHQRCADKVRIL